MHRGLSALPGPEHKHPSIAWLLVPHFSYQPCSRCSLLGLTVLSIQGPAAMSPIETSMQTSGAPFHNALFPTNSSHLNSPNTDLYLPSSVTLWLWSGSLSLLWKSESALKQKDSELGHILQGSLLSTVCTAYSPVSENRCIIYFVQFYNCLQQRVILPPVILSWLEEKWSLFSKVKLI